MGIAEVEEQNVRQPYTGQYGQYTSKLYLVYVFFSGSCYSSDLLFYVCFEIMRTSLLAAGLSKQFGTCLEFPCESDASLHSGRVFQ